MTPQGGALLVLAVAGAVWALWRAWRAESREFEEAVRREKALRVMGRWTGDE